MPALPVRPLNNSAFLNNSIFSRFVCQALPELQQKPKPFSVNNKYNRTFFFLQGRPKIRAGTYEHRRAKAKIFSGTGNGKIPYPVIYNSPNASGMSCAGNPFHGSLGNLTKLFANSCRVIHGIFHFKPLYWTKNTGLNRFRRYRNRTVSG